MNSPPDPKTKKKPASTQPVAPRPPMQSQLDEERGDWEGMGQGRYQPEPETPAPQKS